MAHQDTIRVEVAEVSGTELFGWPGSKLGEQKMEDMVTRGLFASGDFSTIANVLFRGDTARFESMGGKKLHGRETAQYAFHVDRPVTTYEISNGPMRARVAYHGYFWADAATHELVRLETIIDEVPPAFAMRRTTTVIDYQSSKIGEGQFLLPAKVDRLMENIDASMNQNVSVFTNCRQYGTESVLHFDENQQTPAAQQEVKEVRLPAGVRLPMKLESAMDARKSATGDSVVARTTAEVRSGDIVIPAGSEVRGRIRDLRRNSGGIMVVQLEFIEIRAPGIIAGFNAFLEEADKRKGVHATNMLTVPGSLLVEEKHLDLSGMGLVYRTMAESK